MSIDDRVKMALGDLTLRLIMAQNENEILLEKLQQAGQKPDEDKKKATPPEELDNVTELRPAQPAE